MYVGRFIGPAAVHLLGLLRRSGGVVVCVVMTRHEEYEYLLERSRRFYETAPMQIDRGFYDLLTGERCWRNRMRP